jgi:hypothetical protein
MPFFAAQKETYCRLGCPTQAPRELFELLRVKHLVEKSWELANSCSRPVSTITWFVRVRGTYGSTLKLRNMSKSRSIVSITQTRTNLFVISAEDSRAANSVAKREGLAKAEFIDTPLAMLNANFLSITSTRLVRVSR